MAGTGKDAKGAGRSEKNNKRPQQQHSKKAGGFFGCSWIAFLVVGLCFAYRDIFENFYFGIPECSASLGLEEQKNLAKNGLFLMRGIVSPAEVAQAKEFITNISLPTRYLCGASDIQPPECSIPQNKVHEIMPQAYAALQKQLFTWANSPAFGQYSGLCLKELCNDGKQLEILGNEFIQINAWKFPYTLLNGPWDLMMQSSIFGDKRGLHLLRARLTMSLNMSVYQGFHGWHVDGNVQRSYDGDGHGERSGRAHKLFIMVDKSTDPKERAHSNLVVLPGGRAATRNAMIEGEAWVKKTFGWCPARGSLLWGIMKEFVLGSFRQKEQCKVVQDPGDVLFFREDMMHRTQDMMSNRVSLIFDVWTEMNARKLNVGAEYML